MLPLWTSARHLLINNVWHCRLPWKVGLHGILGELVNWINWLHGRTSRGIVEGCFMVWRLVISGVLQGLRLGPIAVCGFY